MGADEAALREEAEEWLFEGASFPGHTTCGASEEMREPHDQPIERQEHEEPVEYEDDADGMVPDVQEEDGDEETAAEAAEAQEEKPQQVGAEAAQPAVAEATDPAAADPADQASAKPAEEHAEQPALPPAERKVLSKFAALRTVFGKGPPRMESFRMRTDRKLYIYIYIYRHIGVEIASAPVMNCLVRSSTKVYPPGFSS